MSKLNHCNHSSFSLKVPAYDFSQFKSMVDIGGGNGTLIILLGSMLGPPPPSVSAIAWVGQLQWLFVILAFYVDKNRIAKNYQTEYNKK